MPAVMVQGRLVSAVLFSLYVNDIPTSSRNVKKGQYAKEAALVAMSCSPSPLVSYQEAFLGRSGALATGLDDFYQRFEKHRCGFC
jgi:hypothetical protein